MKKVTIDIEKLDEDGIFDAVSSKLYEALVYYMCLHEKHPNLYIKIAIQSDLYLLFKFMDKSTDGSFVIYSKMYSGENVKYFLSNAVFSSGDIYEQLSIYAQNVAELLSSLIYPLKESVPIKKIYVINNFDNKPSQKQFEELDFTNPDDILYKVAYDMDDDNNTLMVKLHLHLNPNSPRYEVDTDFKIFINYTTIFNHGYYNVYLKSPAKEFDTYIIGMEQSQALEYLRQVLEHYSRLTKITVSPFETAVLKYYQLKEEEKNV